MVREFDSWSPVLWVLLSLAFICLVAVSSVMTVLALALWVFKLPGRGWNYFGGAR